MAILALMFQSFRFAVGTPRHADLRLLSFDLLSKAVLQAAPWKCCLALRVAAVRPRVFRFAI